MRLQTNRGCVIVQYFIEYNAYNILAMIGVYMNHSLVTDKYRNRHESLINIQVETFLARRN